MDIATLALLLAAGLVAGVVNAVAGGGTFFTFPALMGVGLPPVAANATSAFSLGPGSLASAFAYRKEIAQHYRRLVVLAGVSLIGSILGALILLRFDNAAFERLVPYLILVATLLFALNPVLSKRFKKISSGGHAARIGGLVLQFVTALYGGFFGAGMGIIMLGSLSLTEGDDYHRLNAAKNLLSVIIKLTAIVLFVFAGVIYWFYALVLMISSIAGGYLGVIVAKRVPQRFVRLFVVAVGIVLTVVYFIRTA